MKIPILVPPIGRRKVAWFSTVSQRELRRRLSVNADDHGKAEQDGVYPSCGSLLLEFVVYSLEALVTAYPTRGRNSIGRGYIGMSDEGGGAGEVGPLQVLLLQMSGEIPGIVWSTDCELRFTSCWGSGLADLSLRPNQAVGMTLFEYFGADDSEFPVIAAHRRALEGDTVAWEQDWQGKTYQTRVAPLRDHEGRIVGCTGIAQDITHLKRTQEALRETDERHQSPVEQSLLGVVVVQNFRIVFANTAFTRIGGYTVEELLALSPDQVQAMVHPEDQALVWGSFRARSEGKTVPSQYEYRGVRKDGTVCWLEIFAQVVLSHGKPAIQAAVVDISERKRMEKALQESEARARALLNGSFESIVLFDASGTVRDLNEAAASRLGSTPQQIIGTSGHKLFAPAVVATRLARAEEAVRTRSVVRYEEVRDGFVFDSVICPVFDHDGELTEFVVSGRDITDRKRMEEALRQSEERARALLNAPADAMFLIDTSGRVVEANETWARALKRPVRELVGTCVFDQFPPQLAKLKREQIAEIARTGKPAQFEDEYEGRIIESTLYPVFDGARKVVQVAVSARDVTERKRTEEALRQSEAWARALLEIPLDAMYLLDADGTIVDVNEAGAQRLDCSVHQLVGTCLFDWLPSDVAQRRREKAEEVARTARPLHFEDERDGRFFDSTIYPVFDGEGNVIQVAVSARDVTERKRAEETLRESRERYYAIFEQAADSIVLIDPDTRRLVEFNDTTHQSLGYTRREFEALTITDFEVLESADQTTGHLKQIVQEGSHIFETKHRRKDGGIRDVQVSSRAICCGGRRLVQSIWRDITDRRRAEEALRLAHAELDQRVKERTADLAGANEKLRLEIAEREQVEQRLRILSSAVAQSKEGVAVSDLDGRLLFVNESFAAMHGYRAEEVVGEHLSIFHLPEQMPTVEAANRQIHERGHFHGEIWHARRDGTVFPSMMHSSLLHDQAGRPAGMIGTMRDISEQKRAEEALRESEKRRVEAEKLAATGRLAARVAHEINNPLAGITNCFRLVKAAVPQDHRHYKFTEIIEKEIDRIGRIVRQMFQVHRPDQEAVRDVRVAETIGEVVAILEPDCRERRVRVETHADPAEMTIKIPEGSLRQILYNLLANAIEASPPDGVVRVAASAAKADHTVRITVSDQGGGIPQAVQDHLFEPFFTTKESDTSGGLGLGLSISKGIVDSLRGSLDFQTEPDGGTTFRVVLPAATN